MPKFTLQLAGASTSSPSLSSFLPSYSSLFLKIATLVLLLSLPPLHNIRDDVGNDMRTSANSMAGGVSALGYDLGGDDPMCWRKDLVTLTQVLLSACPEEITMVWNREPASGVKAGDDFTAEYKIKIDFKNITSSPAIIHTNLHACSQEIGFCTPNVAVTPGLVTHADEQTSDLDKKNQASFTSSMQLDESGEHTVIAHSRFIVDGTTQYDVALGVRRDVKPDVSEDELNTAIEITFYVIAGVCLVICFAFLIAVVLCRNHKVIAYSSPIFLILIILGSMLGISTVYVYGGSPSDAKCALQPWMYGIAFVIAFGCLFAKTYRIWRLFSKAHNFKILVIPNWYLLCWVGCGLVIECIILTLWTVIDRLEPDKDFNDSHTEFKWQCDCQELAVWVSLQTAYHILIIAIGVFLTFATRNVATLFNESMWIGLCVWNLLIVSVLIPIQYAVDESPTTVFIIQCLGVLISFMGVTCIMLIPKFYLMLRYNEAQLQNMDTGMMTNASMRGGSMNGSLGGSSTPRGGKSNLHENIVVSQRVTTSTGAIRKGVRSRLQNVVEEGQAILDADQKGKVLTPSQFDPFVESIQKTIRYVNETPEEKWKRMRSMSVVSAEDGSSDGISDELDGGSMV